MTHDRRSKSLTNRLYRLVSGRGWLTASVVLLAAAVAMIMFSLEGRTMQPADQTAAQVAAQTRDDLRLVYVVIGIVVGAFAIMAGVAKLAEPVARKAVAEHDGKPEAHGGLTAIGELKRQYEETSKRHATLGQHIAVLSTEIRMGFESLPCRHEMPRPGRVTACPDEDAEV